MFSSLDVNATRRIQVVEISTSGRRLLQLELDDPILERALSMPIATNFQQTLHYLACETNLLAADTVRLELNFYKLDMVQDQIVPQYEASAHFKLSGCA